MAHRMQLYNLTISQMWEALVGKLMKLSPAWPWKCMEPVSPEEKGTAPAHCPEPVRLSPQGSGGQFWGRFTCCSAIRSCLTLCDAMDGSIPGLPVHHHLPEPAQTRVHRVGDAIQPSHPLSSPFPPAFNLPQHQGLFQWVSSSHQVAKVLKLQLQHQSFQRIVRTDFL